MGARVEGKAKKKGIKAKVTTKFNSKRKLSRMGKKVKKDLAGASTEFITRSAALRRLQITLKDFRRLCILKGIYPRVPTKALQGSDKVYYDIKDIAYIAHEPLLARFREFKTFMKKVKRAAGRNQFGEARRMHSEKPETTLSHLVKERYPRFIDALRDMDDTLSMIQLFAALPTTGRIVAERTASCAKLVREWQYYVAKSRSLKKVFVSVKGVYFQAEVLGESITWLTPHSFTQNLPKEVDFRVMLTFLEFYEVFMKFVLFKLYASAGMVYPPVVDKELEAQGAALLAVRATSVDEATNESTPVAATPAVKAVKNLDPKTAAQAASLDKVLAKLEQDGEEDEEDDDVPIAGALTAAFSDLQNLQNDANADDADEKKTFTASADDETSVSLSTEKPALFSKLTFFINREVPLDWLQFIITAFGGAVGWEGAQSPFKANDTRITHHIVDRPMQASAMIAGREYVQPQFVFDSINAAVVLPVRLYAPGASLPPHLSPFVDDEKEGYMPRFREEIEKIQEAAGVKPTKAKKTAEESEAESEGDEEEDYVSGIKKERAGKNAADSDEEEEEEESSAEELEEIPEEPVKKADSKKGHKAVVHAPKEVKTSEDDELRELSKTMMTKKTKRLYSRMQHGIEAKKDAIANLEKKAAVVESSTKKRRVN